MKRIKRMLSCLMVAAMLAVSVFVPMTASAADYTAPEDISFITDVNAGKIMVGIEPGTAVSDLAVKFSGYTVIVKTNDGSSLSLTDNLGTGCVVTVQDGTDVVDSFTTVVYGDINGDGIINAADSVVLSQTILGNSQLGRVNFLAADISFNSRNDASDLLNMSMHMLGAVNIDQAASSREKVLGQRVRIVTIGDSITEGTGTFNSYRTQLAMDLYNAGANVQFVGPNTSYDSRVSTRYSKHAGWAGYFVGPTSTVAGRSDGIYQQLTNIFPYDEDGNTQDIADIGLMMIGHNNYFRNVALVDSDGNQIFETEYKNLVREIFNRQPNLTLYCATMINQDNGHSPDYNYQDGGVQNKHYGFTYEQGENANLEQWVADLVAEGYDVRFFDLCGATNLCKANGDFDSDDGTHPNEQGQAKMGDAWFNRIIDDVLERNNAQSSGETETKVQSVTLNTNDITVYEGYEAQISATVTPAEADFTSVVWKSSNNSVATVDTFGNIHAVSTGTTYISATSLSGNMSATCKVTVEKDPSKSEMPTNVFYSTFAVNEAYKFSPSSNTNFFKGDIYMNGNACWLETATAYDLGDNWSASLTEQSTINFANNWGEKYYIDLNVGKLKARIADCNKIYKLYYDGKVIASTTRIYDTDNCTYTLRYNKGKVSLIKENLIQGTKTVVLQAEVPNETYYATYSIYNFELWRACLMTRCSLNIIK